MNRDNSPTPREIADLMARIRRLSDLGTAADPSEREAVLAAKRELLARIEGATR